MVAETAHLTVPLEMEYSLDFDLSGCGRFRLFLCSERTRFDDLHCFDDSARQCGRVVYVRSAALSGEKLAEQGCGSVVGLDRDGVPVPGIEVIEGSFSRAGGNARCRRDRRWFRSVVKPYAFGSNRLISLP